jgi:hypothetical protein
MALAKYLRQTEKKGKLPSQLFSRSFFLLFSLERGLRISFFFGKQDSYLMQLSELN